MNFRFILPVEIEFGRKKLDAIGSVIAKYGKNVFLVTGTGSTKKTGLLDRAAALLKKEGIAVTIFDEVTQNPIIPTVYKGAEKAKANGCDVILGIGGGSVMDAAKAIAFACCNGGDITDYIYGRKTGTAALPIVLVPTTCGTGSEGNYFAVLTNPENGDKKSLATPLIYPKTAIVDPELMSTMPPSVLSSVGFDAFAHSFEAYTSRRSNPITDVMALKAMEMIIDNLPILLENPSDEKAWEKMTLASTIGGMVIGVAGVNAAHGMEHPASGLKNIVHGKGLAALTPFIVDYICESNSERFSTVSKMLGGVNEKDCAEAIRLFLRRIKLLVSLKDLGIDEGDVEFMTENCMKTSAGAISNTPMELTREDIRKIYMQAVK